MTNWTEWEEIMKVNDLFRLLLILSADKKGTNIIQMLLNGVHYIVPLQEQYY